MGIQVDKLVEIYFRPTNINPFNSSILKLVVEELYLVF